MWQKSKAAALWAGFRNHYVVSAASVEAANAYLVLMVLAYSSVLLLTVTRLTALAIPVCMATGLADVALHAAGRVKARLPASIPLGLLAALLVAVLEHYRWQV